MIKKILFVLIAIMCVHTTTVWGAPQDCYSGLCSDCPPGPARQCCNSGWESTCRCCLMNPTIDNCESACSSGNNSNTTVWGNIVDAVYYSKCEDGATDCSGKSYPECNNAKGCQWTTDDDGVGVCAPCPVDTYKDGDGGCRPCPNFSSTLWSNNGNSAIGAKSKNCCMCDYDEYNLSAEASLGLDSDQSTIWTCWAYRDLFKCQDGIQIQLTDSNTITLDLGKYNTAGIDGGFVFPMFGADGNLYEGGQLNNNLYCYYGATWNDGGDYYGPDSALLGDYSVDCMNDFVEVTSEMVLTTNRFYQWYEENNNTCYFNYTYGVDNLNCFIGESFSSGRPYRPEHYRTCDCDSSTCWLNKECKENGNTKGYYLSGDYIHNVCKGCPAGSTSDGWVANKGQRICYIKGGNNGTKLCDNTGNCFYLPQNTKVYHKQ